MPDLSALHIGFDAKRALYNRAGLGNYSRNTIGALSKYKPEWQLYLFKHSSKPIIPYCYSENVKFVNPETLFYRKYGSFWRRYGMAGDLKKQSLDLFHGLSHELPVGIEKTSVKSVVTMHDVIFLRFPELFDISYRIIFKQKYKHACQVADRIIAITNQSKQDIMHFFGVPEEKIDIIYQDCKPLFRLEVKSEDLIKVKAKYNLPDSFILSVGTIEKRKNVLSILKAVHEGKIDLPVVIIGRPTKYMDELNTYILNNRLNHKVFFLHHVTDAELPPFYKLATMFIFPSMFEGMGAPILEALNMQLPVITTSSGCFPEIGGKAAHYVDFGNTEQMIQAIEMVAGNSGVREQMISEGIKQASKFNEKDIVNDLVEVYYKAIMQ